MKSPQNPLQFKPAHQYLNEQLHDGITLARILLKNLPLDKGRYLALLHPSFDQSMVYRFHCGDFLPENSIEPVEFAGQIYPAKKKPSSHLELIVYLKNFVNSKTCCYFDDQMHRKEDPIVKQYHLETLRYNEELYLFRNESNFSVQNAEKKITRDVDARWYYMNVISEEDPGTSLEISSEKLNKIASKTTHIVVSAYNGEGYIIWQKSSFSQTANNQQYLKLE